MKKIFTLLTCTILLSTAVLADGHHDRGRGRGGYDRSFGHEEFRGDRDDRGGRRFAPFGGFVGQVFRNVRIRPAVNVFFTYHNYRYGMDQRDVVIANINTYYDQQIQNVENDWSLSDWQRRDAINNLESQRAAEINNIYSQCGDTAPYQGQY